MREKFVIICVILVVSSSVFAAGNTADIGSDDIDTESVIKIFQGSETDVNGPTILLDCGGESTLSNSLSNFMYFVPLISPTMVECKTGEGNGQVAGIISCNKEVTEKTFSVSGEFYMKGKGFHQNTFDSTEMIKRNIEDVKKGEPIKNILNYIKFKGSGYGTIEIEGDFVDKVAIVRTVKVRFNSQGAKSPVTIGLYSVKSINGEYNYESKFNQIIARINILEFKRSDDEPRMGIKIASLVAGTDESKNGLWSQVKGAIANLFIDPIKIDRLGNDTVLELGLALLNEQSVFTFPKAKNLKH